MNAQLQKILQDYPAIINKEQMYKICHISKRRATHLLDSGIVPSESSGKKTRKYTIKIVDVVKYLQERDEFTGAYAAPAGWYTRDDISEFIELPQAAYDRMKSYIENLIEPYPDVLFVRDVSEITGYVDTTIVNWCVKKHIHRYLIRRKYRIPKISLVEYMMSIRFRGIRVKSEKHINLIKALSKTE